MNRFRPGLDAIKIDCDGSRILGGFYRAAGDGPRPTAILLHGMPGIENNLDIAHSLSQAGWNCGYFHYRGCWGSGGSYSLEGCRVDLGAIAAWIEQQPCVDAERLALIGHSWGGYVALAAAATDTRFKAVVALCPLVGRVSEPVPLEAFQANVEMLSGIRAEELKAQYERLTPVAAEADRLRGLPILILTGGQDPDLTAEYFRPLKESVPTIEWHAFPEGDHFLIPCRRQAADLVVSWLIARLGR